LKILRRFLPALFLVATLLFCVFRFDLIEALLAPVLRRKQVFTDRESLAVLTLQHVLLVTATSVPAFVAAFTLALASARSRSPQVREILLNMAAIGETVPTVALIALLVPGFGYGFLPVAVALFLYGLLPVFRNTLTGIESTPAYLVDAAAGCGMTETQALLRVRLPYAAPMVIQGIRISFVVNIAAATIGAAVGAGGLGAPIVSGIRSFDSVLILKGSIPVALMALFVDSSLRALERILQENRSVTKLRGKPESRLPHASSESISG